MVYGSPHLEDLNFRQFTTHQQTSMFKPTPTQQQFIENYKLGKRAGVFMANTTCDRFVGRKMSINGRELVSYASCSYLGLDLDQRVIESSIDFTRRYGTTFSSSRAYLQHGIHEELEEQLETAFGGPCIIGPSTTLSHFSVFPALICKADAIVADRQAHNSLRDAIVSMKGRGVHTEVLPHNDMAALRDRLEKLCASYERVWYVADGVYSIYGDTAPFTTIKGFLDEFPNLVAYVDDAHGMGWTGQHGRGLALQELGHHERLIFVTSLNKAGASGGGLMVFPDQPTKDLVRSTGKTLTFSGPLTPGQLGALKAVTSILLSPEITELQQELYGLCLHFAILAKEKNLKIIDDSISPIFYVSIGDPQSLAEVSSLLQHNHGIFVTPTGYPAVPKDQCGIRITLTRLHTMDQIEALVNAIAIESKAVLSRKRNAKELH